MDRQHTDVLDAMEVMVKSSQIHSQFLPPVAGINYGNSPMGNVFVLFLSKKIRGGNAMVKKTTVVNQAKDYNPSLSRTKLNKHCNWHAKKAFAGTFGETLVCLAGKRR